MFVGQVNWLRKRLLDHSKPNSKTRKIRQNLPRHHKSTTDCPSSHDMDTGPRPCRRSPGRLRRGESLPLCSTRSTAGTRKVCLEKVWKWLETVETPFGRFAPANPRSYLVASRVMTRVRFDRFMVVRFPGGRVEAHVVAFISQITQLVGGIRIKMVRLEAVRIVQNSDSELIRRERKIVGA